MFDHTPIQTSFLQSLIFVSLVVLASSSQAKGQTYGNVTVREVTSIYDADTFRANIAGWPAVAGERVPVRVKGIDAPELKGKCKKEIDLARRAKQEAVSMIRAAKHVELRNMERDKYFRILADVHLDGVSLGQALVRKGLASPYDGGKKTGWCS